MAAATALPARPARPWSPLGLTRLVRVGSQLAVATAGLAGLFAYAPSVRLGPVLLVAAGLLGLPHGAVDHLAIGWSRGRIDQARPSLLLGYLAAAATVAGAALVAPAMAVPALLVLSAAHFAEGEHAYGAGIGWLPAAAAGVTVVAGPLLLRPAGAVATAGALSPGLPATLAEVRGPVLALTVLLLFAAVVGAGRGRNWLVLGELILLAAAATTAPPLVFFAAWFGGWHAPRHLVRLLTLQPSGSTRERVWRLARGAVLPTFAATTGLIGLTLLLGRLPGAVLVVLLALTVPHATVVAWIARRSAQRQGPLLHRRDPAELH